MSKRMSRAVTIFCMFIASLALGSRSFAQDTPPLRVAMAGLVHGHAGGFFSHALTRKDIQIVGIAEPDRAIFDRYAAKFKLDPSLYHADLEEMLKSVHPQAVLGYTSTYDHRKVVEICAKYKTPVM